MTGNSAATLHFQDAKAGHDLVMVKLAKSTAINDNVLARRAKSAQNLIIFFFVRDGYRRMDDVANLAEKFLNLSLKVL